ncbi:terminase large subunit domain-containing protein, partial [Clostridium perfringens]
MAMKKKKTINFKFSDKHKDYIRSCSKNMYNIAEGAVRAGKTVDNVFAFAHELKNTKDKLHLATGSTSANAKLNIGDANGFGLEYIFRGQSHWGKYKGNECLYIKGPSTNNKLRIVIFAGTALANSYKKIRGNSYGMWIATEINLHHPDSIKEAFNRTIAAHKRKVFWDLNPDNPNAFIYKDYIDNYKSKYENGELKGGYNYYHFTIDDNINISDERKEEIKSQYD